MKYVTKKTNFKNQTFSKKSTCILYSKFDYSEKFSFLKVKIHTQKYVCVEMKSFGFFDFAEKESFWILKLLLFIIFKFLKFLNFFII